MHQLTERQRNNLHQLLMTLIDQKQARLLVPPYRNAAGFWFGGGNMVKDANGTLWLCGRYRNYGDSRTGLEAGQRGLECAIFRSDNGGDSFEKVCNWSKAELSRPDRVVLSIEGTALHLRPDGRWELFISSEKTMSYPAGFEEYQKPGTGVWTIDVMTGTAPDATPDMLEPATLTSVLENRERLEYLHLKDPVVFDCANGDTALIFCSHPFSWTSSNSGLAIRAADNTEGDEAFNLKAWEVVPRGAGWDVAATRITAQMSVPARGVFADSGLASVYFYDGAECLRQLDENARARRRPRGYSCEEISGALVGWDEEFPAMQRLSITEPFFVSPWGTGCSRYIETMVTETGIFAIWEQGQEDGSQPLVGHFVPMEEVGRILSV